MDESPRANLSFSEGIKKIRAIVQENIKLGGNMILLKERIKNQNRKLEKL